MPLTIPFTGNFSPGQTACSICKEVYGATCCEKKVGDGPRFPLSYNEASRIARWTRRPVTEVVQRRRVTKKELKRLEYSPYFSASLIVDNHGLYLPVREDGSCVYLQPGEGCTISAVKPHVCAIFPFSLGPVGEWRLWEAASPGYCFAQDIAQDVSSVLSMFGPANILQMNQAATLMKTDYRTHAAFMRNMWRRK